MKQKGTLAAILSAVIVIAVIVVYLWNQREPHYNWNENLSYQSDQPYNTELSFKLLEAHVSQVEVLQKSWHDNLLEKSPSAYVFIGQIPYYNQDAADALLAFVRAGNTAYISTLIWPDTLISELAPGILSATSEGTPNPFVPNAEQLVTSKMQDTVLRLQTDAALAASSFRFPYRIQDRLVAKAWHAFTEDFLTACTYPVEVIARNQEGEVIWLRLQIGKGNLVLCANPTLWSNVYVANPEYLGYYARVFSYVDAPKVLWDEFSKTIPPKGTPDYPEQAGPLQYILSQPALRYSWYTLVGSLLLFMLFRSRREQRVLPLTEPNINRSLEFVLTIGRLHLKRKDYLFMYQQQYRLWLVFLKERYQINQQENKDIFIQHICVKSGVDTTLVQEIFQTREKHHRRLTLKENEMIDFYTLLEQFYSNCH